MNKRFAPSSFSSPYSYSFSFLFFSSAVRVVFILLFGGLFSGVLPPSAFAQGSKRESAYDSVEDKNKDRPDLRDRWMMRGRTASAGQSAAALRLRAHQQKMAMRAAARKQAAEAPETQSGTPWVALGPAPLISDQNSYGAVSGRATAVAIDPTDATGNTVYVAGASGGVWRSTNAATVPATGVAWTPLTDQQASLVNGAVSVKPDGSVVLVGTGEPDNAIDSYYGVGILRSNNQGASWTLIPAADSGTNSFAGLGFAKFAWDSAAASTVVAATATTTQGFNDGDISSGTNRGLYYSADAGQTWAFQVPQDAGVAITPASISATDVAYNAKSGTAGVFYAAIRYHGVYSSTNGQNWTRLANQPNPAMLSTVNCPAQIPNGGSNCPIYRGQLTVVPGRQEMYFWFVSLSTQDGGVDVVDEGIWRSLDGGNSWSQIDETGITNCGDPGNNGCGVDQGYYNLEIASVPDGQATDLYAGAVNLFKCELTNGGTTCSTLDSNFPDRWINLTHVYGCSSIASVHPDEHGLDFMLVGGNAVMYFGNDGGIYRTLNGFTGLDSGSCGIANSFDNLNSSSVPNGTIGSMTQFVSFSLHPTDQNTVLGGTQDNGSPGTSTATGNPEWTTVNGGDGGYNAINAAPAWPPMEWYTANTFVNIFACPYGVDCTTDTFSLTVGSEEVGGDIGAFYTPYILDPQDPYEMLVGTCRVWRGAPTVPPSSLTSLSVDFDTLGSNTCTGEEINLVSGLAAGGPKAGGFLSTMVYATTEGTGPNATAPSGGEVWVTTNAGIAPMKQVTGNINPSNYTISSVAMDTSDATGATAYVGIMGFNVSHVFKTTNAGTSWMDWSGNGNTALPPAPVNALLVDATSGTVYAGTDVGVFMSSTAGPSWTEVGTPSLPAAVGYLPNVPVTAIRLFNYAGIKKLRVSTYGRGIWEYELGPDYTNVIANTPQTVYAAQNATFNGTLTAVNGYSSAVNLSCTGAAPSTCKLNPAQATPPATYTLTAGGAIGDYTFNAHAVGTDGQAITHDAAVTLHVVDFNISTPNPDVLSVIQGGTSNAGAFQVTAAGSFSGTVVLSCASGLPAGAACVFSPSSVVNPTAANPVTVTMMVTAGSSTPIGGPSTVTLAATVTGAPAAKTQTFTLTVTAPAPDFTLAVTSTPNSTVAGQNVTWNGTLTALRGYDASVNLSCVGTAPGTCTFNPSSLVPAALGASFTVTVGSETAGAFNFSIQGTDGTLTHTQAVGLTVGTDVTWSDTGSNAATVSAGQSATYSFSAVPLGGGTFRGTVSFACPNLPALTSCSFSPPSIAAGAGTIPVTLTIATTGPNQGAQLRRGNSAPSTQYLVPNDKQRSSSRMRKNSILHLLLGGAAVHRCDNRPVFVAALAAEAALSARKLAFPHPSSSGNIGRIGMTLAWLLTFPIAGVLVRGIARRRPDRNNVIVGTCVALAGLLVLVACGGALGGGGGGGGGGITVTLSPSTPVSLYFTEAGNQWPASATQQQFTATVSNTSNASVTWQVNGVDGGNSTFGTITSTGTNGDSSTALYTAPGTLPSPSTFNVTAISAADSTKTKSDQVSILTPTTLGAYPNIQVSATAAGGAGHVVVVGLTVD